MPSMNPGLVTRSCMVSGSWQSMQATGCATSLRASTYGIRFISSNPLVRSPPPSFRYGPQMDAWHCMQVPGCFTTCWRSVKV